MPIYEILRMIRKELNISQESLARELNVSFATMNRWENNKARPSRLAILQIKNYAAKQKVSAKIINELDQIQINAKI